MRFLRLCRLNLVRGAFVMITKFQSVSTSERFTTRLCEASKFILIDRRNMRRRRNGRVGMVTATTTTMAMSVVVVVALTGACAANVTNIRCVRFGTLD